MSNCPVMLRWPAAELGVHPMPVVVYVWGQFTRRPKPEGGGHQTRTLTLVTDRIDSVFGLRRLLMMFSLPLHIEHRLILLV